MHPPTLLRLLQIATLVFTVYGLSAARPSDAPDVTYTDVPAAQRALFDRAIDAYGDAGLSLPPIEVFGHRTEFPCQGRRGVHRYQDGRSRLDLCTREAGPGEEFLILHELAHAWDATMLTPARRAAFLELRGLEEWRSDDPDRWHTRGAEHAAEIIAWGVIDRPVRILRIEPNDCASLHAGYVALTGVAPPHAHAGRCRNDGP